MPNTHSPLPWSVDQNDISDWRIEDNDGQYVCTLPISRYLDDRPDPRADSNAALIVRAVNAHADLVAALTFIVADADLTVEDARTIARAALASAKGE